MKQSILIINTVNQIQDCRDCKDCEDHDKRDRSIISKSSTSHYTSCDVNYSTDNECSHKN